MKEIEIKYLVGDNIPDLNKYKYVDIEQAYLNIKPDPTIRIRKYGDDYFLTYKNRVDDNKKLNIATEYELPINKEVYDNLMSKTLGNVIKKRRYLIDIDKDLVAELDIYFGYLEGLKTVEVEFKSEDDYLSFKAPSWFLDNVTGNRKYLNSSLSSISSLDELKTNPK